MMEHLIRALESGKRRGYDEIRTIESTDYLFQYAIKQKDGVFETYFLMIEESKYDVFEDYADEESYTFQTLVRALEYLQGKGADTRKLKAIKGCLPF